MHIDTQFSQSYHLVLHVKIYMALDVTIEYHTGSIGSVMKKRRIFHNMLMCEAIPVLIAVVKCALTEKEIPNVH